jgi:hypothetical protein
MYIYARDIDLPFSTILVLDFGTVPIVCRFYYVFFLLFILTNKVRSIDMGKQKPDTAKNMQSIISKICHNYFV